MTIEQLLSQEFAASHTIEAAEVLEKLPAEERTSFLKEISPNLAARLVQLMTPSMVASDLEKMAEVTTAGILAELPPDTGAMLLRRMNEARRIVVLDSMPQGINERIRVLLRYPENTAGALMDPNVFTLFENQTVEEALAQISRKPEYVRYYIPVIDRQQLLKGVVCIRELMRAESESVLNSLVESDTVQISADSRREAILDHPGWQILHDLPVVDSRGRFLGILSYQILRHLEDKDGDHSRNAAISEASKALGELYWLGVSAFVQGTSSLVTDEEK